MPPTSATLAIHLKPRAKRPGLIAVSDDGVELAVNAPPVDGKANAAMIELLADALDIPKSAIALIRGQTSRNKVVAIDGLSREQAVARLRALTR